MNNTNVKTNPREQKTLPVEKDNEVSSSDGKAIENEKDVHEIEAGNVGEPAAKKDMLDSPANDLVGQPDGEDDES